MPTSSRNSEFVVRRHIWFHCRRGRQGGTGDGDYSKPNMPQNLFSRIAGHVQNIAENIPKYRREQAPALHHWVFVIMAKASYCRGDSQTAHLTIGKKREIRRSLFYYKLIYTISLDYFTLYLPKSLAL